MNTPYSENDVDLLYRLIGKAVWHLQHLENALTLFAAMKRLQKVRDSKKISEKEAYEELEKQRKKTLGPLIESAKREAIIPDKLLDRFDKFLDERNWLIHKCVINEFLSLRNSSARSELFSRIDNFSEEATSLRNEIYTLLKTWFQSNGYDINKAHAIAETMLKNATKS
ncbi:MAG TPA: hypothetical protein ACFYEF_09795 [Candidatus Wunengus sp. YC63]|uniref:hypothetical protein n=1 Tax=Candidatus Wunengus sp. YC63 TaxID=3367699 RepID=UPI0040252CBB